MYYLLRLADNKFLGGFSIEIQTKSWLFENLYMYIYFYWLKKKLRFGIHAAEGFENY